jgi:N-acetylneuraminic acid mutarotase
VVTSNGTTQGWEFDSPGGIGNETGGSGGFAIAAAGYPNHADMDTSLETPVTDLTGDQSPILRFDNVLPGVPGRTADVDVSTDGGATWTTVWENAGNPGVPGPVTEVIPLPQAAGQPDVQARFHYIDTSGGQHWSVDNVFLGNRPCAPTPGGLVVGSVSDGNTRAGIDGVSVTGPDGGAVTAATPDPALPHGFYSMFVTSTGRQALTATRGGYTTRTAHVDVRPDRATAVPFTLGAGKLTITRDHLSFRIRDGRQATGRVTIANTGRVPVTVTLGEEDGPSAAGASAAQHAGSARAANSPRAEVSSRAAGHASRAPGGLSPLAVPARVSHPDAVAVPAAGGDAAAWAAITGYPVPVMDSGVATDPSTGDVYSIGGYNGYDSLTSGYAYDGSSGQWKQLPSMQYPREAPATALIGGKIYVAGGWNSMYRSPTVTVPPTEVYDPATSTWSGQADSMPDAYAAGGVAALDGLMYVIGGCDAVNCGHSEVQVYDPATDTWTLSAPYPEPIAWESCGAITGKIYCAGGVTDNTTSTTDAFSYDPRTGTWSKIASLPIDLWGSGYAAANGQLLVSGGVTDDSVTVTSQGFAYDPLSGAWSALPDAPVAVHRGGSGCGFYLVGGSTTGFGLTQDAEQLPGYGLCGPVDLSWLSESRTQFTLRPGQRVTVSVTVDASATALLQPGVYTAALDIGNNTPYQVPDVGITVTVPGGEHR